LAATSGNITDEMIEQYIEEQEGNPLLMIVDLKSTLSLTPRLIDEGSLVSFFKKPGF